MAAHVVAERRRWGQLTAAVLGVLVVANVMNNRVLPAAAYVPWNVAIAGVIVVVAQRMTSIGSMGFTEWRRGLFWGATILVATAAVLLVAVSIPILGGLFHDKRVSSSLGTMLYQAGVRIPFGTALLEEIAFRGVLPALFALRWGVVRGCLVASLCFGMWHVLPALGLRTMNPVAHSVFGGGAGGVVAAVAFAVVGTMLGGLFWCWIRVRSGSIVATMLAHVATNSVGYVIAWFVTR